MEQITALDFKIKEMAARIRELREIQNLTTVQMAEKTGVSEAEYIECENGNKDLNFAFIYRCPCLENPMEGEPGRLQSMGSQRVGHN